MATKLEASSRVTKTEIGIEYSGHNECTVGVLRISITSLFYSWDLERSHSLQELSLPSQRSSSNQFHTDSLA